MGIFFTELFCQLNYWTKQVNWNRECKNNLAFSRNFGGDQIITFEEFEGRIVENMNKRFAQSLMHCFDSTDSMYMKARCSLLILNRMSIVFPKTELVAATIQRKLQALVDAKDSIKMDLWTLAGRCNENLRKKMESFPSSSTAPVAKDLPKGKTGALEESKEIPGAKGKEKAEEKRREAERVIAQKTNTASNGGQATTAGASVSVSDRNPDAHAATSSKRIVSSS